MQKRFKEKKVIEGKTAGGAVVKSLPANAGNAGDADSIPGLGRSLGSAHGRPLQYSCLENSIDIGAR